MNTICKAGLVLALFAAPAWGRDELQQQATWKMPTASEVRADLQGWLDSQELDERAKLAVETLWPPEAGDDVDVLDRLTTVLAAVLTAV